MHFVIVYKLIFYNILNIYFHIYYISIYILILIYKNIYFIIFSYEIHIIIYNNCLKIIVFSNYNIFINLVFSNRLSEKSLMKK